MAHFAEIAIDNRVIQVIAVDNKELLDENGVEQEAKGAEFCHNLLGGTWVQTSYNGNMRQNFAAVGYTYDPDLDVFVPPVPTSNDTVVVVFSDNDSNDVVVFSDNDSNDSNDVVVVVFSDNDSNDVAGL